MWINFIIIKINIHFALFSETIAYNDRVVIYNILFHILLNQDKKIFILHILKVLGIFEIVESKV